MENNRLNYEEWWAAWLDKNGNSRVVDTAQLSSKAAWEYQQKVIDGLNEQINWWAS